MAYPRKRATSIHIGTYMYRPLCGHAVSILLMSACGHMICYIWYKCVGTIIGLVSAVSGTPLRETANFDFTQ